jgi:gliding motility-associated lipoprotein GldH
VAGVLLACNPDRIFEDYQGMENLQWDVTDTVAFDFIPANSEQVLATIGIRYNDEYEYHNLYVKFLMTDSLGVSLQDSLINIELFDSKTGKPLGDGFGNVFTKYDTLPFGDLRENRLLRIQFLQYMRKDQVQGIEAVGLKLVQK